MKTHINYFLIFFVLSNYAISFSQNQAEYFGAVIIDSISYTYKINISEVNGNVKGYSMTDLGGEHETRSNIFGEYDKINKELNFRETAIVYTKSPVSKDDFCFMNVTVKNFSFGKSKDIKTNFFGLFSDNTECVHGKLVLSSIEKVEARLNRVSKRINNTKRIADSVKEKINPLKMMDTLNMNILRKNQTLSVFSKEKKINLTIYDGGKEDGDKITIMVNGKILVNQFEAKKNKKSFLIDLIEDKTTISIKANNEGLIAPNTVIVEIKDNINSIRALSNLQKDDTTQIDILKNK